MNFHNKVDCGEEQTTWHRLLVGSHTGFITHLGNSNPFTPIVTWAIAKVSHWISNLNYIIFTSLSQCLTNADRKHRLVAAGCGDTELHSNVVDSKSSRGKENAIFERNLV